MLQWSVNQTWKLLFPKATSKTMMLLFFLIFIQQDKANAAVRISPSTTDHPRRHLKDLVSREYESALRLVLCKKIHLASASGDILLARLFRWRKAKFTCLPWIVVWTIDPSIYRSIFVCFYLSLSIYVYLSLFIFISSIIYANPCISMNTHACLSTSIYIDLCCF